MQKENLIQELSFNCSLNMIRLFREMEGKHRDLTIYRQLLRSGTSIGANVIEAQGAQSLKDFVLKISISQKEAKETLYWLKLLMKSDMIGAEVANELLSAIGSIIKVLSRILITSKARLPSKG